MPDLRADEFGYAAVLTVAISGARTKSQRGVVLVSESETSSARFVSLEDEAERKAFPTAFLTHVDDLLDKDDGKNYFIVQQTADSLHIFSHERSSAGAFVARSMSALPSGPAPPAITM